MNFFIVIYLIKYKINYIFFSRIFNYLLNLNLKSL